MSAAQFYNSEPQGQGHNQGGRPGDRGFDYSGGFVPPSGGPPPPPAQQYNNYTPPPGGPPAAQQYNTQSHQQNYPPPTNEYNSHNNHNGNYSQAPPPPQGQGQGYGMKPSAPYAPPPPPQNQQAAEYGNGGQPYDNAPFSQADEKTGPRFAPRKRINDIIPLVLFIAAIAGFAVLSGIAIRTFIQVNGLTGSGVGVGGGRTGSAVTLN